MASNIQVAWVPLDGYKAHIAQADLDFTTETNWRVSFSNALYDGSVIMKPRYVTVDNLGNPAQVTLTMNGIDTIILPFERTEKVLTGNMGFLDFSAPFGSCRVLISEGPFTQKATADNLYGSIFPSLKNYQQTYIAASVAGPNPSHTITLNAGEICVIAIMSQNSFNPDYTFTIGSYNDLELFDQANSVGLNSAELHTRWFGIPYTKTQFANIFNFHDKITNFRSGAAGVNYTRIGFVRAINPVTFTIDENNAIGNPLRYTTFILNNCKIGDALDVISDTRSMQGGSNPTIASVAAGTQYTLPAVNLSGLKRFALMCTGVTNTTLASAQAIGSVSLAERFDAQGVSFSTGWVEKAGTTDNPVFTHAAAAGQTLEYAMIFLKGG
jgi:hypothetical protein